MIVAYAPSRLARHNLHIYVLELCFTLCMIFIGAKHFIVHFRLTEPIKCLNTLN